MVQELKKDLMEVCRGKRSGRDVLRAVRAAGYIPDDHTKESGYFNIRICVFGGYVRIYIPNVGRSRGEVLFQAWEPVKLAYSGAPMFSGRPSYF